MSVEKDPVAECHFEESEGVRQWVVDNCPWCGKTHRHGAGSCETDADEYLGHRVAHCSTGGGIGYHLVNRAARDEDTP